MSGKQTDDESRTSTRRTALRVIGGTGAACLTIPGLTAAESDLEDEYTKSDAERSVSEEEMEVSAEEMLALKQEVRSNANPQIPRTKEFEGSFEVAGLEIGVFGTLGPCEAEIGVTVLNQTDTATLTCSDYTRTLNFDLLAAELDIEIVVDFDNDSVTFDAEGCYYKFTSWECGSESATFYFQ